MARRAEVLDLEARLFKEGTDIREREAGILEGYVPLDLINRADEAVDKENLDLIGRQVDEEAAKKHNNGQITPISSGIVEERPLLEVMDGFHRYAHFSA